MKTICILVPEMAVAAAIVDPRYMFSAINQFRQQAGQAALFDVLLVAQRKLVELDDGQICIRTDALLEEISQVDLIIVPAIIGDIDQALEKNRDAVRWLAQQHAAGAEIASLCIGAFLLGAAGLLNNKSCSTHWLFAERFESMFPSVRLAADKVVTEQDGIYTSGGAQSYWNLLVYLVEKYASRELALTAAKFFQLDTGRHSQSPFVMFRGQKDHKDSAILQAQTYIEAHYSQKIQVNTLAELCGVGRRTFERRFKQLTSNTIMEYVQRVRIEVAKKELERGFSSVAEVMLSVGYSDSRTFRNIFRKQVGMTPVEYRAKYRLISQAPL